MPRLTLLSCTKQPTGQGLELLELARVQVPPLEHKGKRTAAAAAAAEGAAEDSVCIYPSPPRPLPLHEFYLTISLMREKERVAKLIPALFQLFPFGEFVKGQGVKRFILGGGRRGKADG